MNNLVQKFVSLSLVLMSLLFTSSALASPIQEEINSYVAFLSKTYGQNVIVKENSAEALGQLERLDLFLEQGVVPSHLLHLTICDKAVCGEFAK